MRILDIITKKKSGKKLSNDEIEFVVKNFTNDKIPKYQMSALLMAIWFNKMDKEETTALTLSMANSGKTLNLSSIEGVKVDKHSTGGVGDKTTLIISPIVASLSVPIAKMSGRSLGHTGGTIDKLEAIPGLKTSFTQEEFIHLIKSTGICIASQSENLAPADKKIYALRDVTSTVDNISLIAASIMSKKIASGCDAILLDVKTGSGAFMKTLEDSIILASEMVSIGTNLNRNVVALITNMDIPLGNAIGNTLEIVEVIETLKGKGPKDLTRLCYALAKEMLNLSGLYDEEICEKLINESISTGLAFNKFKEMVSAQGGDVSYLDDPDKFSRASIVYSLKSDKTGYITKMDTELIGLCSGVLGSSRVSEDTKIDHLSGIIIKKKTGDFINIGDTLAIFHTNNKASLDEAIKIYNKAINFDKQNIDNYNMIYAKITADKVVTYS